MKNSPCTILAALGISSFTAAQVTLSQDFDNGALDVPGSVIDLSDPSRPGVTLEPRRFIGNWPGDHWWVSFSIDGVAGTTPRFRLPTANAFQTYTDDHRWVWSTTPADASSWTFFDNGFVDGNGFYRVSNNAPFADDEVYVAYFIPYPYSRTVAHTAELLLDPLVRPTSSADAAFVLGMTAGTAGGGYTDDVGRSVPALPLYGYMITDGSGRPKKKVVVTTGNHSGEPTGSWTLEGFVDFVRGTDPDAVALRRVADVFVYPSSDPEGRYSGYFRSNPENPTENHNRFWDSPVGFTDVTAVSAAMVLDTGGHADFFFDFHGFGSATDLGFLAPTSNPTTKLFLDALMSLDPSLMDFSFPNPQPGATAARWAAAASGLSATVTLTPEAGVLANQGVARFALLGEHFARALLSAIESEGSVRRPGSGSVFQSRVLARNPAMYLRLDEPLGSVATDASGNGRNGTFVGGVGRGEASAFVRRGRRAVRFEGTAGSPGGEYVRVPDFSYVGGSGELTLAFWFKTSDVAGSGEQYVFSHGPLAQPSSLNVFFQETPAVGTGNRLRTVVLDADDAPGFADVLDIAVAPADGQWHFYTLVVEPALGATLYLDGFPAKNRAAIGGGPFDPGTDLFLAARSDLDASSFYGRSGVDDGLLDEVVLFDRALDADAVLALARSSVRTFVDVSSFVVRSGAEDLVQVLDRSGMAVDAFIRLREDDDAGAEGVPLFVPESGLALFLPPGFAGQPVFDVLAVRGPRGRWRGGSPR